MRLRPLFPQEKEKGATSVISVSEDHSLIKITVPDRYTRDFAFHACIGPEVSQGDVLHMCGIPSLLEAAMNGYNVTIFCYGQTGSGKTYTMSGREEVIGTDDYTGGDTHDGIMSRAVQHLYQLIQNQTDFSYSLKATYLEIYNEGIFDLLTRDVKSSKKEVKNLPVKWDAGQGFYVPGLKSVACADVGSMMNVIRTGMKHRHVGSHELNIESSRSHSIMTITVCASTSDPQSLDYGTPRFGKICFVDLAGSERLKDSKSEGAMLKETTNINKSLFVLGKVISCLADKETSGVLSHVPYRDSKLTKLLMDSLGGCAMALMIACCSPSSLHVDETLSTLTYATRAKNIQNRPVVQYDPKEQQIAGLRREIDLLRQENVYLREQLRIGGPPTRAGSNDGGADGFFSPPSPYPLMRPGTYQPQPQPQPQTQPQGQSQGQGQGQGQQLLMTPPHVQLSESPRGIRDQASREVGLGLSPPEQLDPLASSSAPQESGASINQVSFSGQDLITASKWGCSLPVDQHPLPEHLKAPSMVVNEEEMQRRLKETQALLARFAEENNRLARENDKLVRVKTVLTNEHSEVLDEIETLRTKLGVMETAVVSGTQSPSLVKYMLSNALNPQAPPSPAMGIMHPPSGSYPPPSPLGAGHGGGGMMMTYGAPQGQGQLIGRPPSQGNRALLAPLSITATGGIGAYPPQSPLGGGYPPQSPLGGGYPPQSPLGGGIMMTSPNPHLMVQQQHPQVMTVSSSSSLGLGQGSIGSKASSASTSGGIIVSDPSKMAMLLGLGGGGGQPMGLGQQQQFAAMSGGGGGAYSQPSPPPLPRPLPVKPSSSAGRK